jgi:hypothetical protein
VTAKIVGLESKKKEKDPRCTWCGSTTEHPGYSCPRISAIEFYEDWMVSRVEFHDSSYEADDDDSTTRPQSRREEEEQE